MNASPIFIHSLFRCGSTYLFQVFRKSPRGYRCYQEALHETVAQSRNDPSRLLGDLASAPEELRHGNMELPHFYELYEAWPAWRDTIDESDVYGGYFRTAEDTTGIALWRSLIAVGDGRPVFQECRTSGRIAQLRAQLGGYHIYLWRNPWDQWRSYHTQKYFPIVNRIILNAPGAPPLLARLRGRIASSRTQVSQVQNAIAHLYPTELSEEQDYLVFYTLWCLGLIEGLRNACFLLSIDELSSSSMYREAVTGSLDVAGISGLDFSGAAVPLRKDHPQRRLAMFQRVEAEVNGALAEDEELGGYLPKLDSIRRQRNSSAHY